VFVKTGARQGSCRLSHAAIGLPDFFGPMISRGMALLTVSPTQYRSELETSGCALRPQCIRKPEAKQRKIAVHHRIPGNPNELIQRMRTAIDSSRGRQLYSQRIATVEPVFANLRHNKAAGPLHLAGQGQGGHAVAAVLPSAQHREAGPQSSLGVKQDPSCPEPPAKWHGRAEIVQNGPTSTRQE